MAATVLKFDAKDVLELWTHSKESLTHRDWYGEPTGPGLFFVHDEGVYLMSNGEPSQPHKDGDNERVHVVYAEGFDPNIRDRDEVLQAAARAVGGDDFVEYVKGDICEQLFAHENPKTLVIEIDENEIRFAVECIRKSPGQELSR